MLNYRKAYNIMRTAFMCVAILFFLVNIVTTFNFFISKCLLFMNVKTVSVVELFLIDVWLIFTFKSLNFIFNL